MQLRQVSIPKHLSRVKPDRDNSSPSSTRFRAESKFRVTTSQQLLLVAVLALTFFISCPMEPIHSNIPLFVRAAIALSITLLVLGRVIRYFPMRRLATPPVLLLILMTFSLTQSASWYAIENIFAFGLFSALAILVSAAVSANHMAIGIAIGGCLVALYSAVYSYFYPAPEWATHHFMGAFLGWNNLALTLIFAVPAAFCMNLGPGTLSRLFKFFVVATLGLEIYLAGSISSLFVFCLLL